MEIRQFKLLNGEDIIAVMNTRYGDHYIIERPVQIAFDGMGRLVFSHWFPLSEQIMFKLYKNRCIQHVPVNKEYEEAYTKYIMTEEQPFSDTEILDRIKLLQETLEVQRRSQEEYDELEDFASPNEPKKRTTIH